MSKLKDLNQHLFDQLDALKSIKGEALQEELCRSKVMVEISAEIIKVHNLKLSAAELVAKHVGMDQNQPLAKVDIE